MRSLLFLVLLAVAGLLAQQAAAQSSDSRYVTQEQFRAYQAQVDNRFDQILSGQREILAAVRAPGPQVHYASASRSVPLRYTSSATSAADDGVVDLGGPKSSEVPVAGLPETGRLSVYGNARILVPIAGGGYVAAGPSVSSPAAQQATLPASYGSNTPVIEAAYHRGSISSPFANLNRFSRF